MKEGFDKLKLQVEAASIRVGSPFDAIRASNEWEVMTKFVEGTLNVRATGSIPGTPTKLSAVANVQPVR